MWCRELFFPVIIRKELYHHTHMEWMEFADTPDFTNKKTRVKKRIILQSFVHLEIQRHLQV